MVEVHNTSECGLTIYQSVSVPTILDVLTTPLVRPAAGHQACANAAPSFLSTVVIDGVRLPVDCARMVARSIPRSVEAITTIQVSQAAYIRDLHASEASRVCTDIQLRRTGIWQLQDESQIRDNWMKSALQFLKIPAVRPQGIQDSPPDMLDQQGRCLLMPRRPDEGIVMSLSEAEADIFMYQVSIHRINWNRRNTL
jgi:hypothetical protein